MQLVKIVIPKKPVPEKKCVVLILCHQAQQVLFFRSPFSCSSSSTFVLRRMTSLLFSFKSMECCCSNSSYFTLHSCLLSRALVWACFATLSWALVIWVLSFHL